jgi:hypothetical protein
MSGTAVARELVGSLPAPAGTVSASLWFDRGEPYIRVYLAPSVLFLQQNIPTTYRGYRIVVEPMPHFTLLHTSRFPPGRPQ